MTKTVVYFLTSLPVFFLVLACHLIASEPMSAIDWLAEKINDPPEFLTTPNEKTYEFQNFNQEIKRNELRSVSKNSIGMFSSIRVGLDFDIWSRDSEDVIAHKIMKIPKSELFFLNRFLQSVLLIESDPPIVFKDSEYAGILFLRARLLKLISMGAIDAAEELITRAEPSIDPNLHDIWAKISFLTRRLDGFCNMVLHSYSIQMFPEHRIICLARSGDWNAAALALATYSSINEINETLERLLINYLDHEAELKIKRKDLCLKESSVIVYLCAFSGIKPLDSELPIAFLYTNLSRDKSLRARINASEEFVKSGALNPNILFSNYKIKQPSTSGGVWARAKLIQELDEHYKNSELNQLILLEHLSLVVREFVKNDLITQFSQIYAEKLYQIKPKQSNLKLYEMVLALILLSDLELDDWRAVKTNNLKLNLAIYLESEDIGLINKNTNVEERLSRYFTSRQKTEFTLLDKIVMEASMGKFPIGRNSTNEILNALSQGRKGFVLVHALFLISAGKNSDLFDLQTGLASLVRLGLIDDFRMIAKEILILDYFKNSLDFS